MGRSAGFSLGGSYVPHRQQPQQRQATGVSAGLTSGSFSAPNVADHNLHTAVSDNFGSHGLSASYHSQVRCCLRRRLSDLFAVGIFLLLRSLSFILKLELKNLFVACPWPLM